MRPSPSHLNFQLLSVLLLLCGVLGTANRVLADLVQDQADIVIGYGATEAGRLGGQPQLQAACYAQFGTANAVAAQSGSPARQHIVGFIQSATDCDNLTSTGGMVGWLGGRDGHVADVVDYANSLAADLVTYITQYNDNVAGVAEQPGRNSAYNNQIYWTYMAHESGGHNWGLNHGDSVPDPTKTIMLNNYCGGGAIPPGYYTNPNIWLNGVKLLGTGTCVGGPIYGGDDAYEQSLSAQGVFDRYERVVYGSNRGSITYRWQFNKPAGTAPAGTVVADDVAGAQAVVRGTGATFTGQALRLPGGTTGNAPADSIAAYVDLPNGIFSAMKNFTIEVWAAPQSAQNWGHVIDIGRCDTAGDGLGAAGEYTGAPGSPAPGTTAGYDDFTLSYTRGTDLGSQRFELKVGGTGAVTGDSSLPTNAGDLHHYAITFTDTTTGGVAKWYRDGALISTLNVGFHAANIHDVNNWLGRSMYSGDSQSSIDYYDVRIQGIALNDGNVAANYLIGPNDAKATLYYNDAYGYSGFTDGSWEFGRTPVATRDYETGTLRLLSPYDSSDHTFPGRSLSVTGGSFMLAGKSSKVTTVNDLRMNGGSLISLGDNGLSETLAGNLAVTNTIHVRGANGPLVLASNLSGNGSILYTENPVTLTGTNSAFTGQTIVGDGRFSTLTIDSEARLGSNPTSFHGDSLTLNRGILVTTQTLTLDDSNRGIRIGPSGGLIRPNAGTTLTIADPISSPAAGDTIQTSPLGSNPTLGILIFDGQGTTVLTNPNNSHNAEIQLNAGALTLSGNGRLNVGNHTWPVTLNGIFTDNSAYNQTLGGPIAGNGSIIKGGASTLTISGTNTFSGGVTINGGTLYANTPNAANGRAFSYVNGITVNNGATLRASANALFGWDGSQEHPITVNAGGSLVADGGGTGDVAVGTVVLAGGTMASSSPSTAYGSWRFDEASDLLSVLADSTVSATNVKFGNPGATVTISAGRTLNFTGTITDATTGGISYLTKKGSGTLLLAGANNYSGATAVSAGTLLVNGALSGSGAVNITAGGTLSGTGTIKGAVTIASNATHAPGNPVGTQNFSGAMSYASSSHLRWTLTGNSNAAGAAGSVNTYGAVTAANNALIDLSLNAAGSTTNYSTLFWTQARTWTVLNTNGGMTGTFILSTVSPDANGNAASAYGAFSLVQGSTGVTLQWTPRSLFAFQGANFGNNLSNPAISGLLADPDGDGIPNILEAFYGTNPNADGASPLQTQTVGGHLGLTFPRSSTITDVVAKVQGADSLSGPWTDLAQSTGGAAFTALANGATVGETGAGTTKTVSFVDSYLETDPAHPTRFLRLWIQPQ